MKDAIQALKAAAREYRGAIVSACQHETADKWTEDEILRFAFLAQLGRVLHDIEAHERGIEAQATRAGARVGGMTVDWLN